MNSSSKFSFVPASRNVTPMIFERYLLVFTLSLIGFAVQAAEPMTWGHPAGPQSNRISREINIPLDWSDPDANAEVKTQQDLLWELTNIPGAGGPLIFQRKLYLLVESDTGEPGTGYNIRCWFIHNRDPEAKFSYSLPPIDPSRTKTPPVLIGDSVWRQLFCLMPDGELLSLDSDLGNMLWSRSLSDILGRAQPPRELTVPLVFEHLIFLQGTWPTEDNKTETVLVALDRRNAQVVWVDVKAADTPERNNLVNPVPTICQNQVMLCVQTQLGSIELRTIRTGELQATIALPAGFPNATEILFDERFLSVLATDGNQNWRAVSVDLEQIALNDKDSVEPQHVWEIGTGGHASILQVGEKLFAASSAGKLQEFSVLDAKTIQEIPLQPEEIYQLQWVDKQLLVTSRSGQWYVFGEDEVNQRRLTYSQKLKHPLISLPVIVKKRIYLRSADRLGTHGPFDQDDVSSALMLPFADRAQDDASEEPGTIQIIPAVAELKSGQQQNFQVIQYNNRGAFMKTVPADEVQWTWDGPGDWDADLGSLSGTGDESTGGTFRLKATYQRMNAESRIFSTTVD